MAVFAQQGLSPDVPIGWKKNGANVRSCHAPQQ